MKDIYKMTKEELIAKCKRLQSENERLQDELDGISDCYVEMENQLADQINMMESSDCIKDITYFKLRLELEGLLTPELESFMEDYLKYHNEMG